MPGLQIAREPRPAQIEITIGQLEIFITQLGVDLKWQILRAIQNRKRLRKHFDVAGRELRIFGPGQAGRDFAANLNDIFGP